MEDYSKVIVQESRQTAFHMFSGLPKAVREAMIGQQCASCKEEFPNKGKRVKLQYVILIDGGLRWWHDLHAK